MNRYDPDPDKPYGHCSDCDEVFAHRDEMHAHLAATFADGKSHRARTDNPTRHERIQRELGNLAESAMYSFVDDCWKLLDEGVTEEEITAAVSYAGSDFADGWESALRENA